MPAPGKDIEGFIDALGEFRGTTLRRAAGRVHRHSPRQVWPWEWVTLHDLGPDVHEAPGSVQMEELLRGRRTLAAGTVLFTALTLRTLDADAAALFVAPGPER